MPGAAEGIPDPITVSVTGGAAGVESWAIALRPEPNQQPITTKSAIAHINFALFTAFLPPWPGASASILLKRVILSADLCSEGSFGVGRKEYGEVRKSAAYPEGWRSFQIGKTTQFVPT
jgi:hypothetical protein